MTKRNGWGGLPAMLVFAVFAGAILLVLLSGADTVQRIHARDQRSYDRRTAAQYIATRVHQADARGMVSVREIEGQRVLVLGDEIEGVRYETLVYCRDGWLCELFTEAGLDLPLEFGEQILPAQALDFRDEGAHIRAQLTLPGGGTQDLLLALRSERRGRP